MTDIAKSAGDAPKRPSLSALMLAQEALGNARDIEQRAGNTLVAELLNDLTLTVFKVALQDDLDEYLAAHR